MTLVNVDFAGIAREKKAKALVACLRNCSKLVGVGPDDAGLASQVECWGDEEWALLTDMAHVQEPSETTRALVLSMLNHEEPSELETQLRASLDALKGRP